MGNEFVQEKATFDHCLRPVFNEYLFKRVLKGDAINLIAEHGLGRRRTLDDLEQCLGGDMLVLRLNLKSYKESYAAFIKELWRQLGSQGEIPSELASVLEHMEASKKPILLIMHNFDALLDNPQIDSAFNVSFFDHLNSMRNQENMCLLCVTVKAHDQSLVMIDGKPHSNSWLDLQPLALTALSHQECSDDLKRRALNLDVEQQAQLLQTFAGHAHAYALLEWLVEQVQLCAENGINFPKKLKTWKREFA